MRVVVLVETVVARMLHQMVRMLVKVVVLIWGLVVVVFLVLCQSGCMVMRRRRQQLMMNTKRGCIVIIVMVRCCGRRDCLCCCCCCCCRSWDHLEVLIIVWKLMLIVYTNCWPKGCCIGLRRDTLVRLVGHILAGYSASQLVKTRAIIGDNIVQ